jgi:hypothetical protein
VCTNRICSYNVSREEKSFHFLVFPLDVFLVTSSKFWKMVAIFAIDNLLASTSYGVSNQSMTVSSISPEFSTVVRIAWITIWDCEKFFLKPRSGCAILTCNGSRGLQCRQPQACQGSLQAHTIHHTMILGSNDALGPFGGAY